MSEYDIKAVQLNVRSSNAALPRQWTTILCSLTADGIRYSSVAHPEKVMLLIDLAGIESIGNYDTGKSEPAFQVKWKGTTTLHKCADDTAVRNWVDKVMAAKLGPSNMESDSTDSYNDDDDDGSAAEESSSSGSEKVSVKSSSELKKSAKSEEKSKSSKDKSKTSGKAAVAKTPSKESNKSKTAEVKSKSKDKSSKSKDKKDKDKKAKSGKENGNVSKKGSDEASAGAGAAAGVETPSKAGKRTKSASTPVSTASNNSYVPQWAAHYDGIRVQERQSAFQKMELEDLVKLISGGLERTARDAREKVLTEWANQKRAKLAELHEVELQELQKKQQRELEDVTKRFKEFSEQPF